MIKEEIKKVIAGNKELRKFGLVVGGVFAILGVLPYIFGNGVSIPFLSAGLLLMFLGAAVARLLYWPYRAWMALAILLGFVMTKIILTVFFFVILTPLALSMRFFGKKFLDLGIDRSVKTYWRFREHKETSKEGLERQF